MHKELKIAIEGVLATASGNTEGLTEAEQLTALRMACGALAEAVNPAKIVTTYVFPPIPYRGADWQARYADDCPDEEGRMDVGYGATEQAAFDNLTEPRSGGEVTLTDGELYER